MTTINKLPSIPATPRISGSAPGPGPALPLIIAVCGDTASGKSSIVRALREKGFEEIVQLTSRDIRPGEIAGSDYHYVPTDRFLDLIRTGAFFGIDRVGSSLYGVNGAELLPKLVPGYKGVVAAGPNTIAGIRASLPPNVRFGAVFVDVSPDILAQRLISRGRDSGADLESRIERIRGTRERYAPRLPEFDIIVNNDGNGTLIKAIKQTVEFSERLLSGETAQKTGVFPAYKMTPKKRIAQYLFDQGVIAFATQVRDHLLPAKIEDTINIVRHLFEPALYEFFKAAVLDHSSKSFLTDQDEKTIRNNLIPHTLNVYAVSRQVFHDRDMIGSSNKRLGRLFEFGEPERAKKNLDALKAASETLTGSERDLIALTHDIGKLIRFFEHPEMSARLIDEYALFEFISDITPEKSRLIRLLIKYHQNIGDLAYAFLSWQTAVTDMFNDPETRSLLRNNDGSVNLPAVNALLNMHKFQTACDVAGSLSEKGGLRNINLELYFRIIEGIRQVFNENPGSYEAALEKLTEEGKSRVKEQLSAMLYAFDPLSDKNPNGADHYWRLMEKSMARAISEGIMTEAEKQRLLKDFAFIDNKYCPHLWWMYFGPAPVKQVEPQYYRTPDEPPTSIWNAYIMTDRIIRALAPDLGKSVKANLTYYDRDGKELAGREKEYAAAWEEHEVFKRAGSFRIDGDTATFVDAEGNDIEAVKAKLIPGVKVFTIRFEHYNLSFNDRKELDY